MRHFAIIQIWGLGDLVMTTPVISEFRRLHPEAKLTLIVQGSAQAKLMEGSLLVDQILEMPPRSNRLGYIKFFWALRHQKIDVAFLGTRIDAVWLPWAVKFLAKIPVLVGDGEKSSHLYDIRGSVDSTVHRVDRMLETFALWSLVPPKAPSFTLPRENGLDEARLVLDKVGLKPGYFVAIHPGSSITSGVVKRIPADVAQRVASAIVEQRPDLSVAFIFGPDEVDFMSSFSGLDEGQVIVSGLSLHGTMALIQQSAGFIGSDSGLGHIAAAFSIPTITLFGPTIASETAPYGGTIVNRLERLQCQPCWGTPLYFRCPFGVKCLHELPESQIVSVANLWRANQT